MTIPTVLIAVMWFSGYVSGYTTTVQEFSTRESCEVARAAWLNLVKDRGRPEGNYYKAECVKK